MSEKAPPEQVEGKRSGGHYQHGLQYAAAIVPIPYLIG